MTEESNINDNLDNQGEEPQVLQAETVFFVIKDANGSFRAVTDVSQKIELARAANLQDVYTGCRDIVRAVDIRQTADTVMSLIANASNKSE